MPYLVPSDAFRRLVIEANVSENNYKFRHFSLHFSG